MALKAKCPRCKTENFIQACQNCGGTTFDSGPIAPSNLPGLFCHVCRIGETHYTCHKCGCMIPATMFKDCFIASQIYGAHSSETRCLRLWRDHHLRSSCFGRLCIWLYYHGSPRLLPILQIRCVTRLVRAILSIIVSRVQHWLERHELLTKSPNHAMQLTGSVRHGLCSRPADLPAQAAPHSACS